MLQSQIEALLGRPVISLPQHAAYRANKACVLTGLLASPTTLRTGIYAKYLANSPVVLSRKEQQITEMMIRKVIAGQAPNNELAAQVRRLLQLGANEVILGCTELSVINHTSRIGSVIDPLEVVVEEIFTERAITIKERTHEN